MVNGGCKLMLLLSLVDATIAKDNIGEDNLSKMWEFFEVLFFFYVIVYLKGLNMFLFLNFLEKLKLVVYFWNFKLI